MIKIKKLLLLILSIFAGQIYSTSKILTNLANKNGNFYKFHGDVFAAIKIPKNIQLKIKNLQDQITKCISKNNFSPQALNNLHITLQIIGNVNHPAHFKKIHKILTPTSKKFKQFNFAKHLPNFTLHVANDGIVKIILPKSNILTALAIDIRKTLQKNKIKINKRFDFPNKAHITIGIIDPRKVKVLAPKIKNCKLSGKIRTGKTLKDKSFLINNFVILKSNRPQQKRIYETLSIYNF